MHSNCNKSLGYFFRTPENACITTQFGIKCNGFFCSSTTHIGQKKGDFFLWECQLNMGELQSCVLWILVRLPLRRRGPSNLGAFRHQSFLLLCPFPNPPPPPHISLYILCVDMTLCFISPLLLSPCDQPYRSHPIFYRAPHFALLHLAAEPPLNSYWLASTDYLFATSS